MAISAALLLAVSGPLAGPVDLVTTPQGAAVPLRGKVERGHRVRIMTLLAPSRSPDLRSLSSRPRLRFVTTGGSGVVEEGAGSPADLVEPATYRQAEVSGPLQLVTGKSGRARMAAGVSLKVVQSDGILSPLIGMSGPVGKALTRVAMAAADL